MSEIVISIRCYVKIVMHCLKYPHSTVNGLILCEKKKKNSINYIEFVDCVPLFHSGHGLTPCLEMALIQISNYYKNSAVTIGGYYQANKYFLDSTPNIFAQRICEKLWENNSDSVLVMVNNFGLASALDDQNEMSSALTLYQYNDGKWKLKTGGHHIDRSTVAFTAVQEFIFKNQYHLNVIDFDNHLDDIKADWNNKAINDSIDEWISVSLD